VANGPVAPAWGRPSTTHSGVVLLAPLPPQCKCGLRRAPRVVTNCAKHPECASLYTSPISRRTPVPSCGCAPAWESRRISLRRPGSRPRIALFVAPEWTISIPSHWYGIARGRHSNRGGVRRITGSYCSQRRAAVRPRISGSAAGSPRLRRCAAAHPDATGSALAQCGAGGRHGGRRGAAADSGQQSIRLGWRDAWQQPVYYVNIHI